MYIASYKANKQFLVHIKYLSDETAGLWYCKIAKLGFINNISSQEVFVGIYLY